MTERCRKLTKEEKKRVWANPESNAGAGWHIDRYDANDPQYRQLLQDARGQARLKGELKRQMRGR